MSKQLKEWMYKEYKATTKGKDGFVFVDYQKTSAEELRAFRNALRKEALELVVIKNAVFKKLLQSNKVAGFETIAIGPTAVIVGEGDALAQRASRFLETWAGEHKPVAIRGGLLDGTITAPAEVKKWKDLPTREQALSIIAGTIKGVGAKLASQIKAAGGKLASQIKARGEGKGEPKAKAE